MITVDRRGKQLRPKQRVQIAPALGVLLDATVVEIKDVMIAATSGDAGRRSLVLELELILPAGNAQLGDITVLDDVPEDQGERKVMN